MFQNEGEKNLKMELLITKRSAMDVDTEFARKVHHAAYRDVIVKQFGSFDEKVQDEFFFKSWKPKKHEILLSNAIEAGYFSVERLPDRIVVHELVLLPKFQNKGIGSKLLKEVLQEAKRRNIPVQLQVLKENVAQNLYRKIGFKDIGGNETHIQMEFKPSEIHVSHH